LVNGAEHALVGDLGRLPERLPSQVDEPCVVLKSE
jgi:hypothetical protein